VLTATLRVLHTWCQCYTRGVSATHVVSVLHTWCHWHTRGVSATHVVSVQTNTCGVPAVLTLIIINDKRTERSTAVGTATGYRTGRPGDRIPVGATIPPPPSDRGAGTHPASYTNFTGSLSRAPKLKKK
jgi:hypothetical protein